MKDEEVMRVALELSLTGNPSPNPYVGAVIVKDGKMVSQGYHHKAGMAHAEVEALKAAEENGIDVRGATLFVTLEPCSHWGRTPPCSKAIIAAGIAEVVYAADDPTEKVKGREELTAAGIKVRRGVLEKECKRINEVFFKHSLSGRPFVAMKTAMTLDAQVAASGGQSKWITGEESRQYVQALRSRYDAILVGIGTVLADNPHLTARIEGGRDPLRIVLDDRLRIPLDANVLADGNAIIAALEGCDPKKLEAAKKKAEVWLFKGKRIDLDEMLSRLGKKGITSVMVEGGPTVYTSFLEAGLIDKYHVFIAPKLMGGTNTPVLKGEPVKRLEEAVKLRFDSVTRLGEDLLVEAYPSGDTA